MPKRKIKVCRQGKHHFTLKTEILCMPHMVDCHLASMLDTSQSLHWIWKMNMILLRCCYRQDFFMYIKNWHLYAFTGDVKCENKTGFLAFILFIFSFCKIVQMWKFSILSLKCPTYSFIGVQKQLYSIFHIDKSQIQR